MNELEAIDALKPHLQEYLKQQGVHISGNFFKCISPDHDDAHPSCSIGGTKGGELFRCLSCGFAGSIFHASHALEGKPLSGAMFYKDTLPYLAEKFGIEYERDSLSEADRRTITRLRAYSDAANVISFSDTNTPSEAMNKLLEDRGWSLKLCTHLKIGTVESRVSYLDSMKKLGWSEAYLDSIDLMEPRLFQQGKLIFTFENHAGQPVGFAARTSADDMTEGVEKYRNSSTSDIFRKGSLLYNFHNATRKGTEGPMYIFEGYADVATATLKGLKRCVALCSLSASEPQMKELMDAGIRNIVLCLDGDDKARGAIEEILDNHLLQPQWNFRVKLIELPPEEDPDSFIKNHGIEKFRQLHLKTPFEWRVERELTDYSVDGVDVAKRYLPSILAEEDRIERERMVRTLSSKSSVPETAIRDEIDRLTRETSSERREKTQRIVRSVVDSLDRGQDPRISMESALMGLDAVEAEFRAHDANIEETFVAQIDRIQQRLEEPHRSQRAALGPNLLIMNQVFEGGLSKDATLYVLGGKPSMGKTSFLRHLSFQMAMENDDMTVMYINIDDDLPKTLPAMVAVACGMEIRSVHRFNKLTPLEEKQAIMTGWVTVRNLATEGRLIMKDSTEGTDLHALESHIRTFQRTYPGRDLLVIFDNFHNLTDSGFESEVRKDTFCGNRMKDIVQKYNVPMIVTAEMRKATDQRSFGRQDNMDEIAGSRTLSYRCDVLAILHSELNVKDNTDMFWYSQGTSNFLGTESTVGISQARKHPIVMVKISKNKDVGGWKGKLYFAFDEHRNQFKEIPEDKIIARSQASTGTSASGSPTST
jgi:DNA primase catalytic core